MRGLRSITLALAVALAIGGCADPAAKDPRPLTVTPDRGPVSQAVPVVITGADFNASASTDFAGREESELDSRFAAYLGPVALRDVRLQPDGSLTATVPEGLPIGPHDLDVVDPEGRRGSLGGAYRVLADTDTAQLVAGYRIDEIGPRQAWIPFEITVTAVDGAGTPVAAFNGAASISDLTGTAVPGTAALFRNGVWTGFVEIRGAHAADQIVAADGAGHTGTSNPFRVAPSPAAALRFATPARTTIAGDCSGPAQPLSVALVDAYGAPTVAEEDLPLTTAAAADLALFADDQCSVPLPAPVLPAGSSGLTAWFRSTRAGDAPLDLSAPSLLPATQQETILSGPPVSVAFVSPAQTVNAGACSQPATLEVRDAWGNAATSAGAPLDLSAAAGPDFRLFSDSGCTVQTATLQPVAGTGRGEFWFSATTAGQVTVSAAGAGLAGASQVETIAPEGSASRLVFLTPARDPIAGSCSDVVTVQAQDSYGNAVTGAGAVQVALTPSPAGGIAFFADSACSLPIPGGAAQIGAGRSTTGFYFQGTAAGSVRVTASSTTLTSAEQVEQIRSAAPASLAFTSAPQTVTAGNCSGLTSLTLRDGFGNTAVTGVPLAVPVAVAPSEGFALFADPLCSTPAGGVTIAAGASGSGFYFKGTLAGTVTLDASGSGLTGASQAELIRAAAADRLAFATAPQTVLAGDCSGAVTVEARDPLGNASPLTGGAALGIAAAPGTGFALFSDAACGAPLASVSIPPNGTSASFFFRATAAGPLTLTSTSTGLTAATQGETVLAAPADRLVFSTAPQSVQAGSCSGAVGLEARDPWGNPSPLAGGASVSLTASPDAGFAFHAGAGCGGLPASSIAIPPGASAVTLSFSGTVVGGITITAASAPLASAVQLAAIVPLAPTHLAFATAPQSVNATHCSLATVVELRDALENPAPAGTVTTVSLASSAAAGFGLFADSSCTLPITSLDVAAGATAGQFWFSGIVAEPVTVTATAPGLGPATQVEQVLSEGSASRLVIVSPARTVTAGGCSELVVVQSQDSVGNPVALAAPLPLTLSALPSTGVAFFADVACSIPLTAGEPEILAGGSSAGFHFSATVAGPLRIAAAATGLASAEQLESVVPAAADRLVFTSGPQTVRAGVCSSAVGLALRDGYGNAAVAGADVAVALSAAPTTGFAFYSDAGCGALVTGLTLATGTGTTTLYFAGRTAGTVTVTASGLGAPPTQSETITPAAPHHLAITTPARSVPAGDCSLEVTVESRDAFENPSPVAAATPIALSRAPAAGLSFFTGSTCGGGAVTSVTLPGGSSSVPFHFRATVAGAVTTTASAVGMAPDPFQAQTILPAAPDRLAYVTLPQSVTAGACSLAAAVQAFDPYGNAAPVATDTDVALSAVPAAGFAFFADDGCTSPIAAVTISGGSSTGSLYFAGTRAGTVAASATVSGWTAASQAEAVTPGPAASLAWDSIPSPQAQSRPFAVRISALDAWGNVATDFTETAVLSLEVTPPLAPVPIPTCTSGCSTGLTTGAFSSGIWTGSVSVGGPESPVDGLPDRRLVATSGLLSCASNAFELTGTPDRSPPLARIVPTPALIREGQSITFDASGSSDYQTPTANLQVSWDLTGTASAPPPAAPWTAWTTTKTVANTFSTAGTYPVRVAVRDVDGDVGYAGTTVEVRVMGTSACTVDTSSDVDDGATNCRPWLGNHGTDGRVSLREALRVAVDGDTINFSSAMTISGTGTYTISDRIRILGQGVILDTKSLVIDAGTLADPVEIIGLELTAQTAPMTLRDGRTAILRDVHFHDGAGIADYGRLTLERVRMARCTGSCVTVYDTVDTDLLTVRFSEFHGAGAGTALDVAECAAGVAALSAQSNVFEGLGTAVRIGCPGTTSIVHGTFEANGTGIEYYAGAASPNHVLRNTIFSNQLAAAATCGLSTFTSRDHHLLWQNSSNGCLEGDLPSDTADPLYIFPAAGDFRLRMTSPGVNTAFDLGLYVLPAFPAAPGPRFAGTAPDLGSKETY